MSERRIKPSSVIRQLISLKQTFIIFAAHYEYERKEGHFYRPADHRRGPGAEDLGKNAHAFEPYLGCVLPVAGFSL